MEEAVKQLTALVSTGPDWSLALLQLNGDACHMPLPREGHLSVLVEGGTSSATCGRVSQLEVHQLLSSGSQVIYPVWLNGCEVPVIASPPESLAKGANLLGGKPIYLKVDILQSIAEGPKLTSAAPWQSLLFHPDYKPCQGSSAKGRRRGQHYHGGEGAPLLGRTRHIWTCIRELHPKEARPHGPSHTFAHQKAPQPSGRWRLGEPLRLAHFNNHMLKPFSTYKKKLSEESKGQLNLLSTCQATLWASPPKFYGMLVAFYHILLGHVPMSHPFSISQGASPPNKGLSPGLLPLLCLSIPLDPSSGITPQTQQMSCLLAGPHPRQLLSDPLVWSSKR